MRALPLLVGLLLLSPLVPSASAEGAIGPVCFFEIYGPDLIVRWCADPSDPKCLLYTERWGKEGEYMGKTCQFP